MELTGKRILFISAKTFGIPENIVSTFQYLGANVDFYDERAGNSFIIKALTRINRNLIAPIVNRYHKKIIDATSVNKYDYIIVIKGESFSEKNLKTLLSTHNDSTSIIYHWDSIANNHNALKLLPYFDKAYSFDRMDCKKFNINFLPLFYYNDYINVASHKEKTEYDVLFIGTTHSDRYSFVQKIKSKIMDFGGVAYTYYFFQGKIMYYRAKCLDKSIRKAPIQNFHFKPLSKNDVLELYKKSRIIVDIQHPKQTGLTLRTLEALGSKRKLITTNTDIKNYDFYNPQNILVVDRHEPDIPLDFYKSDYVEIPENIYNKYSIVEWIKTLLYS